MKFSCIIFAVLGLMSVAAFCAFGIDKYKSRHSGWRITEKTLLLMALLGGAIGAFAGMKAFHHKTLHKKFTILIPLFALAQIAAVFWLLGWI